MENIAGPLVGAVCVGIFMLVFGGAGVFLIIRTRKSKEKAEASQNWPSTLGQVTQARIRRDMDMDEDGPSRYTYVPVVEYTYEVGGQSYTSRAVRFGFNPTFNNEAKAQAALAPYPVGGQVTVYYNPDNPAEAVLERSAGGSNVGLILGIIFIAVSVCLACPALLALVFSFLAPAGVSSP